MILFALVFTLFLLVFTETMVRLSGGWYSLACVSCLIWGGLCVSFSVFIGLNSLLVLLAALACGFAGASPRTFRKAALVASAVAYLIVFILTLQTDEGDYSRLRERYPYESIAERLSYEPRQRTASAGAETSPLKRPAVRERLENVEAKIKTAANDSGMRTSHLRIIHELHDNVVIRFINSSGFGAMRRIEPDEWTLQLSEVDPVPLAPEADYFKKLPHGRPLPAAPKAQGSAAPAGDSLWTMHRDGLLDFSNPAGFGYVKDRDHVAGFVPHRFSQMPESPAGPSIWQVLSVELVSLLKYESPAVYLSKNLPRMEELRNARTRPLDDFEKTQLAALRKGEDLMVSATTDHMRVLGSLRAAKQCLSCHDAQRGDLLGAFSYKLRRAKGTP